jgi:hypothetical protein
MVAFGTEGKDASTREKCILLEVFLCLKFGIEGDLEIEEASYITDSCCYGAWDYSYIPRTTCF